MSNKWTLLLKVETPETLRSSNSVWPSTSKSPFKSVLPVTVAIPVTFKLRVVISVPIPGPPGPPISIPATYNFLSM